jgi:hypothetical protein
MYGFDSAAAVTAVLALVVILSFARIMFRT